MILAYQCHILSQSYLPDNLEDLTKRLRIVDFWCWTHPEVMILGVDQKHHGVWGCEWEGTITITITKLLEICGS